MVRNNQSATLSLNELVSSVLYTNILRSNWENQRTGKKERISKNETCPGSSASRHYFDCKIELSNCDSHLAKGRSLINSGGDVCFGAFISAIELECRDSNLVDSASSIRLSQRLSHACLSINKSIRETANGSLYQL